LGFSLAGFQHLAHRRNDSVPLFFFRVQLLPSRSSQRVRLDATALFRSGPFARNPAFLLETMQCGKQRSGLNIKCSLGNLANSIGDGDAMKWL